MVLHGNYLFICSARFSLTFGSSDFLAPVFLRSRAVGGAVEVVRAPGDGRLSSVFWRVSAVFKFLLTLVQFGPNIR